MEIGVRSDVGCTRDHNEDSYVIDSSIIAVADGMGGHRAGEVASRFACETLKNMLPIWPHDPAGWLSSTFLEANMRIYRASSMDPGYAGMGTTLTVAAFLGSYVYIGHVGDSRAYLFRDGTLKRLTNDHSIVGELVRMGGLTEEEARVHPRRNIITRAVGTGPDLVPDLYKLEATRGDRLVLCTDGLTEMLDDSEIRAILSKPEDPDAQAGLLTGLANERGGYDNITVVIALIS